ncbi:hypothetical protein [Streptomyces rubiginosohelvolus]|uniref:hypothetical protein n=1 Tax=Streptomyces rubiginosohelvolus TaxID=67362 RepID=UPI0038065EFE
MPMIVDPAAPQVTPPATVASPDGRLVAAVDEQWAGVVLAMDWRLLATPVVNLVLNPSMELGVTSTEPYNPGATGVTRTRTLGSGWAGAYRQVVSPGTAGTATSGVQYALSRPVVGGETVTVSCHTRTPYVATLQARLRNSATGDEVVVPVPQASVSSTWTPFQATLTAAPGILYDRVVISITGAGGAWAVDAVMCETGSVAHPYVDGDQPECVWDGAAHASASRRIRDAAAAATIMRARITRVGPGGGDPVPVRSGDTAWAVGGVGTAYDHEAPLGVPVAYTATPLYADGTEGAPSALSVTVPAPVPGTRDLWVKSLDEPGLSLRVMLTTRPEPASAGRQSSADILGSSYRALAYDTHGAETRQVTVDVPPGRVDAMRRLLRAGVLLAQVRPGYLWPDAYFVPADIAGPTPTGRLGASGGYLFTFTIEPIGRPATAEQPMRMPNWSWDTVAQQFGTFDAVVGSYPTWAALSTNGGL